VWPLLHQLRLAVGDATFFEILRTWTDTRRHGNGALEDFVVLATSTSGQDLKPLFDAWLFTPGRPELTSAQAPRANRAESTRRPPRAWAALLETQAKHRALAPTAHE
jgi:aminopeptidase N